MVKWQFYAKFLFINQNIFICQFLIALIFLGWFNMLFSFWYQIWSDSSRNPVLTCCLHTWYIEDGRTTFDARMRYVAGLLNTLSSLASKSASCEIDCSLISPTTLLWLFTDIIIIIITSHFITIILNSDSIYCFVIPQAGSDS